LAQGSESAPGELGVGLVYWSALDPLFEAGPETVAVLELEPQSLWEKAGRSGVWQYRANEGLLQQVARFPQHKLVHGIGQPLGGTTPDPVEHLPLLRHAVDLLDPAWISEHLSFNRVEAADGVEEAGFLLPPRQSRAGVRLAADNIACLRSALGRPVAFETGVSYLEPRADELDDASFFRGVAELADCGILLDLHNLWCNELNGRARVADVLAGLPLDRVWEVHLAGGMPLSGYWLDAHSGAVPAPLIDLAADIMPSLRGLRALMFEISPEHLPTIGIDGVYRQLEELRGLWALKPPHGTPRSVPSSPAQARMHAGLSDLDEARCWEHALVDAIRGRSTAANAYGSVAADPGVGILRELVGSFRRASLVRALRYTMTSLLAGLGSEETQALLDAYVAEHDPDPYPAVEADQFAGFLKQRAHVLEQVPYLAETLEFEHGLLRATLYGVGTDVEWSADPTAVFEALDAGHLPTDLQPMHSHIRIG